MYSKLRTAVPFIAAITGLWAILNLTPLADATLTLDVVASRAGQSQLYFPADRRVRPVGHTYAEDHQRVAPIAAGQGLVTFPLPATTAWVRWDPVDGAGSFRVRGLELKAGWSRIRVPLAEVSPNAEIATLVHDHASLLVETLPDAKDPSVVVRLPWVEAVAAVQLSLAAIAAALVTFVVVARHLNGRAEEVVVRVREFVWRERQALRAVPFLIALAFTFYFVELGSFSISVDDEFAASRTAAESTVWVAQGRWTVFLVERFVMPQAVVPFLPTALFCVSAALSYVLVLAAHRITTIGVAYLLFPLFAASPIWIMMGAFYANLPATALGLLLSSAGALLFRIAFVDRAASAGSPSVGHAGARKRATDPAVVSPAPAEPYAPTTIRRAVPLTIVIAVLVGSAIGVYQAFLFAFASLGFGVIVASAIRKTATDLRAIAKQCLALAMVLGLSAAVYSTLNWVFRIVYAAGEHYIGVYFRPELMFAHPLQVLGASLEEAFKVYAGSASVFGAGLGGVGALLALGVLSLAVDDRLAQRPGVRAAAIALALASFVAPFALHPVAGFGAGGIAPPLRSLIGVPYVVWFVGALALSQRLIVIRCASAVALMIAVFQLLYTASLYQAAMTLGTAHDRDLAVQIYDRVAQIHSEFDRRKYYKVDFYGAKPLSLMYPGPPDSTIGASIFEWDGGDPHRIAAYMRLIGFTNLVPVGDDQRRTLTPLFKDMAIWPDRNSVKIVGDVTLIKLGDTPGFRHTTP